ncbi:hypothetical protein HF325_006483 [Metschnikowia pulcherrima]|uniref:Uncharacterized protein n=1 Tax=Metschnikowia pulcherrima TaxID=27326 RepID=A0A8H7GLV9_9ASCO|nr:hypothetical protein HF325_006483 [Metschnikowia pulcherrima]
MNATLKQSWAPFPGAWALALRYFPQVNEGCFITSFSNGALALFSLNGSQEPLFFNKTAHESSVNALEKIDEFTLASASTDGIKVWDLRRGLTAPQLVFSNAKKLNFLSLGSSKGRWLAAGTELVGSDAELHLWDLQNPANVVRSFVDSHHDDITAIEFHKTLPYLMSGSTDGYVNIYNLDEPDEEEALHQVINFASVHLCHFIQSNRISVLSHMETLAFWELNSTDYETDEEPKPREIGDVRLIWPVCEYVVDIFEGYVAYGANLKLSFTIMPFDAESEAFALSRGILLLLGHGEEVVRDVMHISGSNIVLTCGEDGFVKVWELPFTLVGNNTIEPMAALGPETQSEKKDKKKDKKDKKITKEKREKRDKRDKKRLKESRFKPY